MSFGYVSQVRHVYIYIYKTIYTSENSEVEFGFDKYLNRISELQILKTILVKLSWTVLQ